MTGLADLSSSDLSSLPRARAHPVDRNVQGWLNRLVQDGASDNVIQAVGEYQNLRERERQALVVLLRRCAHDPVAQTAVVFLWGGARGRNPTLAVTEEPRTKLVDEPWLRDSARPSEAHGFLWDTSRWWDMYPGRTPADPCRAFYKLWAKPRWDKGLVPGCGTAFGTKVLYWAARSTWDFSAPLEFPIPLIYDVRVYASLQTRGPHAVRGKRTAWTHPQKKMAGRTYEAYCTSAFDSAQVLNRRAEELDVKPDFGPDDIELWHFQLGGDDTNTDSVSSASDPNDSAPEAGPELEEPEASPPTREDLSDTTVLERVLAALAAAS